MYSKSFVLFAAATVLVSGGAVALANNFSDDRGGSWGLNAHQTELDEQYARSHPTITPGTPVRNGSSYAMCRRIVRRPSADNPHVRHGDRHTLAAIVTPVDLTQLVATAGAQTNGP